MVISVGRRGYNLATIVVTICAYCWDGVGGECHSPGCVFWSCVAPDAEQAAALRRANSEPGEGPA